MEKKIKLQFDNKGKKTATISIRLTEQAEKKLRILAKKHNVSQGDVIEKLIELAE